MIHESDDIITMLIEAQIIWTIREPLAFEIVKNCPEVFGKVRDDVVPTLIPHEDTVEKENDIFPFPQDFVPYS